MRTFAARHDADGLWELLGVFPFLSFHSIPFPGSDCELLTTIHHDLSKDAKSLDPGDLFYPRSMLWWNFL